MTDAFSDLTSDSCSIDIKYYIDDSLGGYINKKRQIEWCNTHHWLMKSPILPKMVLSIIIACSIEETFTVPPSGGCEHTFSIFGEDSGFTESWSLISALNETHMTSSYTCYEQINGIMKKYHFIGDHRISPIKSNIKKQVANNSIRWANELGESLIKHITFSFGLPPNY